jgi:CRP-like cAMP-binding protein
MSHLPAIPVQASNLREGLALGVKHENVDSMGAVVAFEVSGNELGEFLHFRQVFEARLCRWLLRMRDLAGDDLSVTQEFLSQMLGVGSTTVSLVASTLQAANLIRYRRGHVRIVDVDGLKEAACECYETVNAHYDLLFHAK